MEITATAIAGRAEIDTSRPFQSVREAVEVFGGVATGGSSRASSASSSKFTMMPPASASPSQQWSTLLCCMKKLELELAEARSELAELKQRQSQMEATVSSVSAQLANGLRGAFSCDGRLRKGKELAVVAAAPVTGAQEEDGGDSDGGGRVRSDLWDETRAEQWMATLEYLPSLSEALAIKMVEDDVRKVKKSHNKGAKAKKKQQQHKKQRKNAVSLVGGIFSKRYSR